MKSWQVMDDLRSADVDVRHRAIICSDAQSITRLMDVAADESKDTRR